MIVLDILNMWSVLCSTCGWLGLVGLDILDIYIYIYSVMSFICDGWI